MYMCSLPAKAGNATYTRPLAAMKKKKNKASAKIVNLKNGNLVLRFNK